MIVPMLPHRLIALSATLFLPFPHTLADDLSPTYIQALAGPDGNTTRAADSDPSAWTNSPDHALDSRVDGDGLWGLPPSRVLQHIDGMPGFDGDGNFAPWEAYPGAPALRTTVDGLPQGDYHVFLLFQDSTQQHWPIDAVLTGTTAPPYAPTIIVAEHPDRPLVLKRRYLGTAKHVTSLSIDLASGQAARSRYVGLAYAPATADYPLPDPASPYSYPYGYPYGDYPTGGASHPRQSGNYFARPAGFGSGQTKRIGQYALRQILLSNHALAIEYLEGMLADHPGRYDEELLFMLAMAHASANDQAAAASHMARSLAADLPPGRFLAGPRNLFAKLHDHPSFASLATSLAQIPVHGPMLGDVTPSSAKVWVRTAAASQIEVIASTSPQLKPATSSAMAASSEDSDFTAVIQLDNLQPDTLYHYALVIDGGEPITSPHQTFHTSTPAGTPASFTIAFGGCAGYVHYNERMWDTILDHSPRALLLLGDNVYIDDPESPEMNRYCYYQRQSRPEFRRLTAATPTYAIWDDHDFGCDDAWGGPHPHLPYWKPMVAEIFRQNWANPSYGDGVNPGVWFDFTIADVHFIMLDGRTYREDPGRFGGGGAKDPTMLGPVQREWLLKTLSASTATFKVIASPVPWSDGAKPGQGGLDTWRGFAAEREAIFSLIQEQQIPGVILIAADRHRSDAWKIERPGTYALYEFMSAQLTNEHTHALMDGALFGYNEKPAFGLLHFDTAAPTPSLRYEIVNIDGESIHELQLSLDDLK
jgi:alkaline phosphatase D